MGVALVHSPFPRTPDSYLDQNITSNRGMLESQKRNHHHVLSNSPGTSYEQKQSGRVRT